MIIAVTIGVTAGVGVWTFQQTPRYVGKFQLLVASGDNPPALNQLPAPDVSGNTVEYDTQIEVLRSPKILKPILQKISPHYRDLDDKGLAQKPKNKEEPLKIIRLPQTKILEISYEDNNPKKIIFVLNNLADAYLKYAREVKQSELKAAIEFVNIQLPKYQQQVSQYEQKLQKVREKYNILDPQAQANELSKQLLYLQTELLNTQVQLKETTSLYQNLEKQVGLKPQEALNSSYLSESPRYQYLLNQLQQVEIELAKQATIFVDDSPIIQTLKEKQANLQSLLKEESKKILGDQPSEQINPSNNHLDSPSAVRLALNQQLVQSANQIQVLQTRSSVLQKQIENVKKQLEKIPEIAKQYTELQRKIQVANESLSRFLEAQEKIQIKAAQKMSPWELLSSPELLKEPIYPNPMRNLSLGLVGGILLGMVAAVGLEKLDNKFHSGQEIKEATPLPILGYIPFQRNLNNLKPGHKHALWHSNLNLGQPGNEPSNLPRKPLQSFHYFSAFLEACMSMYANISLLDSEPLKSIVISSATAGEGKSTIALYLAQVAAVMGQRVLLVEANLRKPQYYQWVDVPQPEGLNEVLTLGLEVAKAIQKVPQWENLSVLMAGDEAANPTGLLASEKMGQLIEQFHQDSQYDLVIYDTPPILGFPDAKILAASTEGLILVTKMGKTERQAFKDCLDELKMSAISLLGLVANGVSRHR